MSEPNLQPGSPRKPSVPISWKLLGSTAVIGLVAATIAIIALNRIQTLNRNLTQTVETLAATSKLASLIKGDLISASRAERNMMLAQSEDGTKRFAVLVADASDTLDERLEELLTLVDEDNRYFLKLFAERWNEWRKNHEDVLRFTEMDSDIEAHKISIGDGQKAIDRMDQSLDLIREEMQRTLDAAKQEEDFSVYANASETLLLTSAISRVALQMQQAESRLILAYAPDEMQRFEEMFDPLQKQLEELINQLKAALMDNQSIATDELETSLRDYLNANTRIRFTAGEKTNYLAYHFVYDIGAPLANQCEALLDGLIERNEEQMQEHRVASQRMYESARNTLLGISILGILVSVSLSFYTGHNIASRLSALSRYAKRIQETGDLSQPTPRSGSDEVGSLADSFEQMRLSLHRYTESLSDQAESLAKLSHSLESQNKEMEQFVYTVSHDLKSPLVSCKGLLGLLKEDLQDGDYQAVADSVERLEQATDQLNQIIDDLLMLSRIGRKSLNLTEVDVHELVCELVDEFEDRIAGAGAKIELDEHLPKVVAVESDTRRVFENLLTNALKYGCNGEDPIISIGGMKASNEIRYFVRDRGPGIDPRYHERIFRLFQRLDTDQPGTGVGLASVAKILDMHGGRVWVESELGKGATFWVAFPESVRSRSGANTKMSRENEKVRPHTD